MILHKKWGNYLESRVDSVFIRMTERRNLKV